MNTPRTPSTKQQSAQDDQDRAQAREEGPALQPPPTGADGGSPAAPVMPQYAKTESESSGRK